jgi:K+/H+ antiporter YhaU regulatory subunit KhtT
VGMGVGELRLRSELGLTLVTAVNAGGATVNPGANYQIGSGDLLVMIGEKARLMAATAEVGERVRH